MLGGAAAKGKTVTGRRIGFAALLWVGLAGVGHAETTSTDLHAAYCVRMLQHEVGFEQTIVQEVQASNNPQALAAAQATLTQVQSALQRVQGYELPRLAGPAGNSQAGLLGLQSAVRAADEDWATVQRVSDTCATLAQRACTDKTSEQCSEILHTCEVQQVPDFDSIPPKIHACNDPTWLPY
jgi:hypothetical protein